MALATAAVALLIALAGTAWQQGTILFTLSPSEVCKAIYTGNPFVESVEIGRYVAEHTNPGDRIAVLGSEPQLYFYSGRRSATGYIYTYPLMEENPFALKMQMEMIAEIEAARPTYLVGVLTPSSWLRRQKSNDLILRWMDAYCNRNFDLVGVIQMGPKGTSYHWDEQAKMPRRGLVNCTFVYRRRKDT